MSVMSSGSVHRRAQRSVRASVAAGLLSVAAVAVLIAVASATWVSVAAVASVLAGMTAARIIHTEVTQSRREAAKGRAELARAFGVAMTKSHLEHAGFTTSMTSRIAARDKTIVELNGTIRLAEKRADQAEVRVQREAKRANEVQERLSALLDDVLVQQSEALAGVGIPEAADLPTIVDLLAWEDREGSDVFEEIRHQA